MVAKARYCRRARQFSIAWLVGIFSDGYRSVFLDDPGVQPFVGGIGLFGCRHVREWARSRGAVSKDNLVHLSPVLGHRHFLGELTARR